MSARLPHPRPAFTLLPGVGAHEDKDFISVDAAGIHEHRHSPVTCGHVVRPELYFMSLVPTNSRPECVDALWKGETESSPRASQCGVQPGGVPIPAASRPAEATWPTGCLGRGRPRTLQAEILNQ